MFEIIDVNTVCGFWPKSNCDTSPDQLLSRMDKAGVSKAFTCSTRGILYDFAEGNDATLKVCRDSKGRLFPVATINPSTYFGVLGEVERIVAMGFRIVRFFPEEQDWKISQKHFEKLLTRLSETNLVLMIPSSEGITQISSVTAGLPNSILIESIRMYPNLAEFIVVAQENPSIFVETHLVGSSEFIEVLVDQVGEDRLVFGSGAPLHCFYSAILPISNAAVSKQAKKKIFSDNILRLIGT
ncbi:MAG: amidohydrolase family protein [Planctomycetota bacterium]